MRRCILIDHYHHFTVTQCGSFCCINRTRRSVSKTIPPQVHPFSKPGAGHLVFLPSLIKCRTVSVQFVATNIAH
ncbi:hypothetical protein M378DRAFT_24917 [Amanita muscaria Koide BX008]|uniref:Uncharacterized protein n=1 Tax=Amanita muscaria (strain Koide BX008) TaxID=946122 RepID=A0A0C2WPV4_AMAMK|nr:hypothetical protein M378DRAFT_24917 [Amanita muscaria Koide BX008]